MSTGSNRSRCRGRDLRPFPDPDTAARNIARGEIFETVGNRGMYGRLVAPMKTERIRGCSRRRRSRRTRPASGTRMQLPRSCITSRTTSRRRTTLPPTTPGGEELKALFWAEAERYKVLPLLGTLSTFFGILPPIPEETTFEFPATST